MFFFVFFYININQIKEEKRNLDRDNWDEWDMENQEK